MEFFVLALNSNFFVGVATIVTGLAAWVVYSLQKKNTKIQAARVLLTEIRTAEERLEQIREKVTEGSTADLPGVLSTNSWATYSPLFISDFDQDELKLLNLFYNNAALIEDFARRQNDYFWVTTEERAKITVKIIADFAKSAIDLQDRSQIDAYMSGKRSQFSDILDRHNLPYSPKKTKQGMEELLERTPSVLTTTCGTKLKKLANVDT
ncbi:MAG: hypothetical protein AAB439_01360 [Patescibacteria group bacterium]